MTLLDPEDKTIKGLTFGSAGLGVALFISIILTWCSAPCEWWASDPLTERPARCRQ